MKRNLIALLALGLPLAAQEHPDVAKLRAEFEKKLSVLTRELEAQKTGSAPAAEEGRYGLGSSASKVYESKGGLSIGGYGEVLYQSKESKDQAGNPGGGEKNLDALRLVFYTGYKFSDKVVFNSEVEFEHGGYSDEHPEGEVVVEFAYLDFLLSKAFNIRAGQMLVPMGFINELHEPPAFLGSRRPMVERTILPTTWHENGAGIHGELSGNLAYRVYVMNGLNGAKFSGEGIRDGRQAGKEANAQSLAFTGRLDWSGMPGLLVGASFYTGNSNQSGTGAALRTTMMDVHAEYKAKGLQVRGLYAATSNSKPWLESLGNADAARETGTRQWGGYLEAGYDLLDGRQSLVPFLRWERFNTQAEVIPTVSADPGNDWKVVTAGVNYKPLPQVAVKADYQKLENRGLTGRNQWNVALGFFF